MALIRKTSCIEFLVVLAFTGFAFISEKDVSIFCTAKFAFGVAGLLLTFCKDTCFEMVTWPRTDDECLTALLLPFWLFCNDLLGLSGVVFGVFAARECEGDPALRDLAVVLGVGLLA